MSRRLVFWSDGYRYRWMVFALGVAATDWTILAMGAVDKTKVRHQPVADGIRLAVSKEEHSAISTCSSVARYAAAGMPHRRLWLRDTGWVRP